MMKNKIYVLTDGSENAEILAVQCASLSELAFMQENADNATDGNLSWHEYPAPRPAAPGGSVTFTHDPTRSYDMYNCSKPGDMSGEYIPAAQVAELVAALKPFADRYEEIKSDTARKVLIGADDLKVAATALARFEKGE